MERVTRKQIEGTATDVNRMLTTDIYVNPYQSSGRWMIDLCDLRGVVRTLRAGTAREMYEYLNAMRETLYIVGRD